MARNPVQRGLASPAQFDTTSSVWFCYNSRPKLVYNQPAPGLSIPFLLYIHLVKVQPTHPRTVDATGCDGGDLVEVLVLELRELVLVERSHILIWLQKYLRVIALYCRQRFSFSDRNNETDFAA